MQEGLIITLLFAAGLAVLVADIFLPSHFILTVAGLGLLAAASYRVFVQYGQSAGLASILACIIAWPALAYIGVKNFHRTPFGRRLIIPNETATAEDVGVEVAALASLIGSRGVSETPLRPVGICRFGAERTACIAETGQIEPQTPVIGIAIRGAQLVVAVSNAT